MSHDPLSEVAYLLEETCNATCPQKCSSGSWKVYDSDKKNWIQNNVLNIDCGIIVPFEHPTKFTCTNNLINLHSLVVYLHFLSFFYQVVPGLLARPSEGCPETTSGCNAIGCPATCYCEDHCSWERCLLTDPPTDCFEDDNGAWEKEGNVWVAKFRGNYVEVSIHLYI